MTALSRIAFSFSLLAAASLALSAADGLIVFSARDNSGYFHLYLVKPDGTNLKKLTFGKNNDTAAQLSPKPDTVNFVRTIGKSAAPLSVSLSAGSVRPQDSGLVTKPPPTAPSGRYYYTENQFGCKVFRAPTDSEIPLPSGFMPLLWLDDDRLFGAVTEAEHTQYAMWDLRENALRAYRKPEYAPGRSYIRVPGMLQYLVMAEYDATADIFTYEWLDVNKGKKMDFVTGKSLSFAGDGKGSHCFVAADGRLMASIGRLGAPRALSPKGWRTDSCLWLP